MPPSAGGGKALTLIAANPTIADDAAAPVCKARMGKARKGKFQSRGDDQWVTHDFGSAVGVPIRSTANSPDVEGRAGEGGAIPQFDRDAPVTI